ncbi:MAG: hypothetical protein WC462_03685 [archaeon]
MMEEMAIEYFKGLCKTEKKRLIKKIIDSLSEKEKVELAKMIIGKK